MVISSDQYDQSIDYKNLERQKQDICAKRMPDYQMLLLLLFVQRDYFA